MSLREAGIQVFDETSLRVFVHTLLQIFAELQKNGIAHRNIKPANLVFKKTKGVKADSDLDLFLSLMAANFEMGVCLDT